MRIHRDERGQTIILVALSLPLLLGFIGIATDVGALFKDKRTMQTAADAAAIAGALNYNYGYAVWKPLAQKASATNGYTDGSSGVTVNVPLTPQWPSSSYFQKTPYVEATVTKRESTIFLTLFGYPSVTVTARAVAANVGPGAGCIYALGQNAAGYGFEISGNASVQASQCGLLVDTSNSPPMRLNGNITLTMSSIGTVGSCGTGGRDCEVGNVRVNPTPVSGIVPYSDPLSYVPQFTCNGTSSCTNGTSTVSCVADPRYSGNHTGRNSINLNPGCYNGLSATGNYTINLQQGNYIINGGLSLNGNGVLGGSEVTIFMTTGTISIGGNTSLNLAAPTSGTYNGILFSSTSTTDQTIFGNAGSTLKGIMYFPDASLTMNGNGATTLYTDFVAKSLSFIGNVSFNDYAALPGVTSPLSSVVLVE